SKNLIIALALFYKAHLPGRVSVPFGIRRYILRDNAPRSYHCIFSNLNAAHNSCRCADGSAAPDNSTCKCFRVLFGTRIRVVYKGRVRAYEYIVFHFNAIPKINTAFQRNPVADAHIILHKAMAVDVAVFAYLRALQHYTELPDA